MALVIGLLNQKGGVGKTTLAVHIADEISRRNHRTLLIDADQQGSALDWGAARAEDAVFSIVGLPRPTIHREIERLGQGYDVVVIDGPPRVYEVARSAIMASDIVLIPVQPSPYDVWAASEIVELVKEARIYKPQLKAAFIINRRIKNTAIGRDVTDALATYDLPALPTSVYQRVAMAESAGAGMTVFETVPESVGVKELKRLVDDIEELSLAEVAA